MGIDPGPLRIQTDSMDIPLRQAIWDALWVHFLVKSDTYRALRSNDVPIARRYITFLRVINGVTLDDAIVMDTEAVNKIVKRTILDEGMSYDWICEIIEIFAEEDLEYHDRSSEAGIQALNGAFERHLFAFRLISGKLVSVTDEMQMETIEDAANVPYESARKHYGRALELLSDRKSPDPANVIKESIAALEALTDEIEGGNEKDFSKRLQNLGNRYSIHQAMTSSWKSLYGYASNKPGARHGQATPPQFRQSEAIMTLATVGSIMNYLVSLTAEPAIADS
jgi:hypothetical protein